MLLYPRFYPVNTASNKDGHFAYAYRLTPGVNKDSHGLKVAELAGLPMTALSMAKEALQGLKSRGEEEVNPSVSLRALGMSLTKTGDDTHRDQ